MILVTGACGFVGRHLVGLIAEHFPDTHLRLMDVRRWSGDLPDSAEFVAGSVEDPDSASEAASGAEVIVNLAGKVEPSARSYDQLHTINVDGASNLYQAAIATRCRLFLHMSSAGVYGLPCKPGPFREDDRANPVTPYQRSKWAAEEALRAIEPRNTQLNLLRPAGIYGPGSTLELPMYQRVSRQSLAVELKGGVIVHPTHVRDVALAVLALIERPAPHGAVFNIGGERALRVEELEAMVAAALGVRRRRIVVPASAAVAIASIAGPLLTATGRERPHMLASAVGQVHSAAVDDHLFRQEYDVPVVRLEDGLVEHISWARASGLL